MGKNKPKKPLAVSKEVHYFIHRKILDSEGKYKSVDDFLKDKFEIEEEEGGFW